MAVPETSSPTPKPARRAPSITRLFFATFFAVTLAGLTISLTSWIDAPQTQQGVPAVLHTLDQLGAGLSPALDVTGEATGGAALVLYQPHFEANQWEPTAARGAAGSPVSRITVREIVGEGSGGVLRLSDDLHATARAKLKLPASPG